MRSRPHKQRTSGDSSRLDNLKLSFHFSRIQEEIFQASLLSQPPSGYAFLGRAIDAVLYTLFEGSMSRVLPRIFNPSFQQVVASFAARPKLTR